MSNQKTTKLRLLSAAQVSPGDRIPIVDVSGSMTSPTGETKGILVSELMISTGISEFTPDNGLSFDPSISPGSDSNLCCYAQTQPISGNFTIMVKAFIPQTLVTSSQDRVIFGIGSSPHDIANQANAAYIGVAGSNLIAYISGSSSKRTITSSFDILSGKPFSAAIVKNTELGVNTFSLYINGGFYNNIGCDASLSPSFINMGCGNPSQPNLDVIVYDAQIFNKALSDSEISLAVSGKVPTANLITSYRSNTLNAGPSQWLDGVGTSHLLLPVSGSEAINPSKDFHLRFYTTSSGYLGNGTNRDVLPPNYLIKSAFLYSDGSPRLSIGTSDTTAPGVPPYYSCNNNRVELDTFSGRVPLDVLPTGVSHPDRTIYVDFEVDAPCTFSFDGYIVEYGTYTPMVAAPAFNPIAGTYGYRPTVSITTSTPGATIRYTTNGSTPTATIGSIYTAPVAINDTTTLKAIAYRSGYINSSVTSGVYTINVSFLLQDGTSLQLQDGTDLLLQ